jgi:hypothetical protein
MAEHPNAAAIASVDVILMRLMYETRRQTDFETAN